MNKCYAYLRLMRFDRPIGILLLLWPTLWALLLAGNGRPSIRNLAIFLTGVVLMRAAGCVINDFADREYDPHVERTRTRPIAAGEVSPRQALVLFLLLLTAAFGLVLLTNKLTVMLSFGGAALAASYPFFKRYTHLPQVVLGLAFGWAVPMAFAAETGTVPALAWWLLVANVLWSVIYDTEYAMVDRDDDLKVGVKSTAILFGRFDRLIIGILQLLMLILMLWLGRQFHLSTAYFIALGITAGLFAYQQILIRKRDRQPCFRAFLNNNWVGAALFSGLLVHYLQT